MASTKKNSVNKSAFVRDQDPNLSAAEVVEKAKGKGITITPAFVYSIRSAAKSAKAKGSTAAKAKPGPKARTTPVPAGGSLDAMIRSIVQAEIRAYFSKLA